MTTITGIAIMNKVYDFDNNLGISTNLHILEFSLVFIAW